MAKTTAALILYSLFFQLNITCAQPEPVFESSWKLDLPMMIGTSSLFLAGYLARENVPPLGADKITGLDRNDINGLDRAAVNYYHESSAVFSDIAVGAMMVAPFSLFLFRQARNDFWSLVLIGAETATLINGMVSVTKASFRRIRPFVYNDEVPLEAKTTSYAREAFFSGHTANAATFGFLSAYMIDQYTDDRALEIVAWSVGTTVPLLTGIFRFRSGNHFPTDILAGYLVGGGTGILVPWLHRVQSNDYGNARLWPENLKVLPYGSGLRICYYIR